MKKIPWLRLLAEFIIVISGVYIAYLLSSYSEDQKNLRERKKILKAIKMELEQFRIFMPSQADYQYNKIEEWNEMLKNDSLNDYYNWRYLEPQYNYHILDYALNGKGAEVIDFELYNELGTIYMNILHLEHAERLMTGMFQMYHHMPSSLPEDSNEYKILKAQNRYYFYKFIGHARDRANILKSLSERAGNVLEVINLRFDPKELEIAEREIINRYLRRVDQDDLDYVKEQIQEYFSNFSPEEIDEILREIEAEE